MHFSYLQIRVVIIVNFTKRDLCLFLDMFHAPPFAKHGGLLPPNVITKHCWRTLSTLHLWIYISRLLLHWSIRRSLPIVSGIWVIAKRTTRTLPNRTDTPRTQTNSAKRKTMGSMEYYYAVVVHVRRYICLCCSISHMSVGVFVGRTRIGKCKF